MCACTRHNHGSSNNRLSVAVSLHITTRGAASAQLVQMSAAVSLHNCTIMEVEITPGFRDKNFKASTLRRIEALQEANRELTERVLHLEIENENNRSLKMEKQDVPSSLATSSQEDSGHCNPVMESCQDADDYASKFWRCRQLAASLEEPKKRQKFEVTKAELQANPVTCSQAFTI